ncbi:hypothetical protein EVG20_g10519 [Dentipellis fragilis]|uniref:XRRM domain-containing protein n=1 Tax=Dentipellis fragilis TaxID=205917 RepID=A0A4Y9XTN7_9AGAM|nr:hypothetical protein EVG20_g10519 [Dentipellis fragilis]
MFVPRSVNKSKKPPKVTERNVPPSFVAHPAPPSDVKGKGRQDANDEEAALLLSLALSDYALWTTPSLRDPNRDGFISLSHLLQTTPYLTSLTNEVALVKALRTHFPDVFETRMIVVTAARPGWNPGGYEIRRKDWEAVVDRFSSFDRKHWQLQTIYIENIPITYRTTAGVLRVLQELLSNNSSSPDSPRIQVQHIVFPPHYQDPPDAIPKCKGFALVTLSDPVVAARLAREWPWERSAGTRLPDDNMTTHAHAFRAGFRTLPKAQWDALQDEYIAYRDSLVAKMKAATAPAPQASSARPQRPSASDSQPQSVSQSDTAAPTTNISPDAPYPPNRVLHARNIHPQTNKTTLRALFSAGLPDSAIDYVDFTKGLDMCYLRLSDPQHADAILSSFSTTPQAQAQPLDTAGSAPAPGVKPIALELLQGRQEAAYWEKIPEKVRREAVMKALGGSAGDAGQKRKRRRGA